MRKYFLDSIPTINRVRISFEYINSSRTRVRCRVQMINRVQPKL